MKIALTGPSLSCCSEVFRQTKTVQEQAECIVPDVCEDIGKISFAQAQLFLKSKESSDHGVNIGVSAEIHVFYITERRDQVRTLSFSKSFEIGFDSPSIASESDIQISLHCMGVQARAVNPRKVSAQLSVRAGISCLCEGSVCIPTDAEQAQPDGLQLRAENADCMITARPGEKSFVINEQLPIDSPEEITAVSSVRAELTGGDCQPIGSKVLVKGGAELELGCETREGTCPVFIRQCLPFSVLVDMPDEDCRVGNLRFETTALYADLNDAINGSRVIELELHGVAQLGFEKAGKIRFLSDAYSTACPVKLEKDAAQICRFRGTQHLTTDVSEHIQVESDRGELVYTFADLLPFSVRDGKAETPITVSLLLKDAENVYSTQQRLLSVETALPGTEGELTGVRIAAVRAERGGEEVLLEASLVLDFLQNELEELQYLTSVDLDTEQPIEPSSLPALTIARKGGRDPWELAKIYHSSVEAIGELNAKYPMDGDLLLIPRV